MDRSCLLLFVLCAFLPAKAANPKLGLTGSAANPSYAADILSNGTYGDYFPIAAGNWAAFEPDRAVDTLFLTWNNSAYTWSDSLATAGSCKSNPGTMTSYRILTSSNSTTGSDGDWDTTLSVINYVTSRAHAVPFKGKTWVKLLVVAGGSGALDEIELFDKAALGDDSWFFVGNSITANAFKSALPDTTFEGQVAALKPGRSPATVRGGIPCIKTPQMFADFSKYYAIAGNCRYWGIELGTNDAWGGTAYDLSTYTTALAGIVDSAKSHGIVPIVARVIATDSGVAKWQVNDSFLNTIDSLVAAKGLPSGPDFYTWFRNHPGEYNTDGVHPNAAGGASIQRLWAQVAAGLDATTSAKARSVAKSAKLGAKVVTGATASSGTVDVRGRTGPGGGTQVIFVK